ncbi:hypothetical protein PV325_011053, partial [Microctonus aethiopoides]
MFNNVLGDQSSLGKDSPDRCASLLKDSARWRSRDDDLYLAKNFELVVQRDDSAGTFRPSSIHGHPYISTTSYFDGVPPSISPGVEQFIA